MKQKQQGIILITVLIFLLVLALLSLTALSTSQLQIHMSHNLGDTIQELQAAEAGLHAGEQQLLLNKKPMCFTEKPFVTKSGEYPWLDQTNTCKISFAQIPVKYLIEQLPNETCRTFYRVTAWATTNNNHPTIVQSIYARPTAKPGCEKNPVMAGRLLWEELVS